MVEDGLWQKIQRLWKDPVISKLIAEGFKELIKYTWPLLSLYIFSIWKKISFLDAFTLIFNFKIELGYVIILLLIISLLKFSIGKFKSKKTKFEIAREKLAKYNFQIDIENGYKYIWQLKYVNDIPKAYDIRCYCNLHELPIILNNNLVCIMPNCNNSQHNINYRRLEIMINSNVEQKYNELKSTKSN